MASKIAGSVGIKGKNAPSDVLTVQSLLNMAQGKLGGPMQPISSDGVVGPETVGAIIRFQSRNFGWSDGRVDPGGKTLARLNTVAEMKGAPVPTEGSRPGGGPGAAALAGGKASPAAFAPAIDGSTKQSTNWALITSVSGKVKMRFPGSAFMSAIPGFFLPPGGVLMTYDATGAPLTLPLTKEELNSAYPWPPGSATVLMSDGSKRSLGPYTLFVVP